jgi:hypothetical protein
VARYIDPAAQERARRVQAESVRAAWAQAQAPDGAERPSIRREPPPRPADIPPTDDPMRLRLADELDYVRRMLDVMGEQLSADRPTVIRHGVTLQTLDIAGQILGHVAAVTRASDPDEAVSRIGMSELKARLLRRGGL